MLTTDSLPDFSSLPQPIQAAIQEIPLSTQYYVALSGGLDSVALLLSTLSYFKSRKESIKAIHIHHGLSPNADEWADYCMKLCNAFGVECVVEKVSVVREGQGIEAAARKVRYEVFSRYVVDGAVLLQGHHLNDQAESFLLKACKGLGPEALAGIPRERRLSGGFLFRPFLNVPRDELLVWAQNIGVRWVEDDSNEDTRFDRNYIRHVVLPELDKRWSSVASRISQSSDKSRQLVEQNNLWNAYHLEQIKQADNYGYEVLQIDVLSKLTPLLQRSVVRYWIDSLGKPQPPESSFERIWSELIVASNSALPEICWGNLRLVRFNNCLYMINVSEQSPDYEYVVSVSDLDQAVQLGCGAYHVYLGMGELGVEGVQDFELAWPEGVESVRISSRQGGESFLMSGGRRRTSLKNCYQFWKTPTWLRNTPLVFYDDQLVFIGIGKTAEGFLPRTGQRTLSLSLKALA